MERIGRRIRLNSSKIKEVSDTNSDYDDLAESIQAGYYLKNGLGSSECKLPADGCGDVFK